MEFTGGLRLDELPVEQKPNSWRHTKNMLFKQGFKSPNNEPGFDEDITSVNGDNHVHELPGNYIGSIRLPESSIIFTINDDLRSEIGIHKDGAYKTIILGTNNINPAVDLLNFNKLCPIEGIFKINYLGEIIIAWCDGITDNSNTPKILNIDRLPFPVTNFILDDSSQVNLLSLFPECLVPQFELIDIDDSGGNIQTGTYFFTIAYEIDDIDIINPVGISRPLYINSNNTDLYNKDDSLGSLTAVSFCKSVAGEYTSKSARLILSNLDTRFKYFRLITVQRISGAYYFKEVVKLSTDGGIRDFTFTGQYTDKVYTSDTVLIPNDSYYRFKSITQLNDEVIAGNVRKNSTIKYQCYANNIEVNWFTQSTPYDNTQINKISTPGAVTFNFKGLMPEEVYALYIGFYLKDGTTSPAFHIPGRQVEVINSDSYLLQENLDILAANPVGSLNPGGTSQFVTTTNAGLTALLLTYIASYPSPTYKMYIVFDTTNIPYEVVDIIPSTVTGGMVDILLVPIFGFAYSLITVINLYLVQVINENDLLTVLNPVLTSTEELNINTGVVKYFQTRDTSTQYKMGYWENETELYPDTDDFDICDQSGTIGTLRNSLVRHHKAPGYAKLYAPGNIPIKAIGITLHNIFIPFDIRDKVQAFTLLYAERGNNLANTTVLGISPIHKQGTGGIFDLYSRAFDFGLLTDKPAISPRYLKRYYQNDNTLAILSLGTPQTNFQVIEDSEYHPEDNILSVPPNDNDPEVLSLRHVNASLFGTIDTSTIWNVCGICAYVPNAFESFYNQKLASTGWIFITDNSNFYNNKSTFGFDTFINFLFTLWTDASFIPTQRHHIYNLLYSRYNIGYRQKDKPAFNEYDFGLPYLYNKDFSALTDIKVNFPYDPFNPSTDYMPYRIPRSAPNQSETVKIGWRTFPNGRYFEMPKNKGVIWKVQAFNQSLIINMEDSAYLAQTKDKLGSSIDEIFLGIGDIFDRNPTDLLPIPEGYLGCNSQWAAFVCKLGYVFCDRKQGKIFIINQTAKEITKDGIRNFFRDNLNTSSDIDNPYNEVGLLAAYDEKHDRLLISKKDFQTGYGKITVSLNEEYAFYSATIIIEGNETLLIEELFYTNAAFYAQLIPLANAILNPLGFIMELAGNIIRIFPLLDDTYDANITLTIKQLVFYVRKSSPIVMTGTGRTITARGIPYSQNTPSKVYIFNKSENKVYELFADDMSIDTIYSPNYDPSFGLNTIFNTVSVECDNGIPTIMGDIYTYGTSGRGLISSVYDLCIGANSRWLFCIDAINFVIDFYDVVTLKSTFALFTNIKDIAGGNNSVGSDNLNRYFIVGEYYLGIYILDEIAGTISLEYELFTVDYPMIKSVCMIKQSDSVSVNVNTDYILMSYAVGLNVGLLIFDYINKVIVADIPAPENFNEPGYCNVLQDFDNDRQFYLCSDAQGRGMYGIRPEDYKLVVDKYPLDGVKTTGVSHYSDLRNLSTESPPSSYFIANLGFKQIPMAVSPRETETIFVFEKIEKPANSFTLSYYAHLNNGDGGWMGNHDYIPDFIYNNRSGLFSGLNSTKKIYKHNSLTNVGIFYDPDTIYKSYIELVFNLEETDSKEFFSLSWLSNMRDLNNTLFIQDKTITHLIVYDENRCSGLINLVTSSKWFTHDPRNTLGSWNYNNFRDMLKDNTRPFLDSDNELITSNILVAKAWFKQNKFLGKFVIVRFIYDNSSQNEFTLHDATANVKKLNR